MIIVDTALEQRAAEGRPVRVGMIGAGFMAWGISNQISNYIPGMTLAAVSNRTLSGAEKAYAEAGITTTQLVTSAAELDAAIDAGIPCVTSDPHVLCAAKNIDVLIEVTGTVEFAAGVLLDAFAHGKSVVMMNAELDATIGPIMKVYADKAGVIL
ncbi:MAG: NAD(P)-dependent oxidoreductase, partial [Armatimonadota bacterium]